MEGPLKELAKLEQLTSSTASSSKSKSPCISDSLDALLKSLHDARDSVQSGADPSTALDGLDKAVELRKKEVEDRQKEIYGSLSRVGKALDKRFTNPLPETQPMFSSPESVNALQHTIATYFFRTGQFSIAETFIQESGLDVSQVSQEQFKTLDRILGTLKNRNVEPALEWARSQRAFLQSRSSPLEFHLLRSQYMHILLSTDPLNSLAAIQYAHAHLAPIYPQYGREINRLIACNVYGSKAHLLASPYADLANEGLDEELVEAFAREYCASLGSSRQVPLRVVVDIGAGGALARIEKGRKLMRERKSEWSQTDELPIEIPLPPENRYHSIFACPVSKEQSTEQNPPMMMTCGHVITKESLNKLSRPGGRVKCPYCPLESQLGNALKVAF